MTTESTRSKRYNYLTLQTRALELLARHPGSGFLEALTSLITLAEKWDFPLSDVGLDTPQRQQLISTFNRAQREDEWEWLTPFMAVINHEMEYR